MAIQVGDLRIGEKFRHLGYHGTVVAKLGRSVSVLWAEDPQVVRLDRREVVFCLS